MGIDRINLTRVDLNLLVALEALLAEESVTRAALKVGIGQSAMSHNLARLRALFGDELLTRSAQGMRPTPRAKALLDPLKIALADVAHLIAPPDSFDPSRSQRIFHIGLPDSVEALFGPQLLDFVTREAPHMSLRFHSTDERQLLEEIDDGQIDLGFGIGRFPHGQTHHKQRVVAKDSYLCMFNARRTGLKAPVSLEDYVRLPHVLTSLRKGERGVVDDALAKLGLSRHVALTTPRFIAVPHLVAGAAVVTTMHARLARLFAAELGLTLSPVPVELPEVTISLLWHASNDSDPGHAWLRKAIERLGPAGAADAPPRPELRAELRAADKRPRGRGKEPT